MKRFPFDQWPCSVARTVDVLGDRWTLLVLRELFYGQTRFEQFASSLGIPRTTLADRLDKLVDSGLLTREIYQHEPTRHEYLLTEKGRDFFGVIAALNAWGDRWTADEQGVPVVLTHESCGEQLDPLVVCRCCGKPVHPGDVSVAFGPGYPAALRENSSIAARFVHDPE